jgi:glycine/D-amino acid oxidase-like deaminating enzyme
MAFFYINMVREEYGEDAAKELMLFQVAQVFALKEIVQKEKLDCDFVLTRSCEAYISQPESDEATANYEKLIEDGLDYVQDVYYAGPKYAERLTGIKGAKAGFTVTGAQLWPYKFVTGLLARLLERTSINVQTHTTVTHITQSHDGLSLVYTSRGKVLAQKVVFATNAYTCGIAPSYSETIMPVKGTCSHIRTPENTEFPPPQLMQTYGLSFGGADIRDYLVPRPDGGVICGGAKDTYIKDRKSWWNNFDDSTLIEPARKHFETVMQDNFRGWEKSGAFVDYLWSVARCLNGSITSALRTCSC